MSSNDIDVKITEEAKRRKDESDIIGSTDEEDLRAPAHRFTTPGGVPPTTGPQSAWWE